MSEHDYHIAAEADVSSVVNRHIWFYFIVLGILLLITMVGLTIMYRFQVDYEKTKKIGEVSTLESINQKTKSEGYLSGKIGVFENKKYVAIDVAMSRFLDDVRKAK